MESLCTVGSDDRLCTVRVGILSLNTPTHQGAPEQCVIADLLSLSLSLFFLYLGLAFLRLSSRWREMFVCERTHAEMWFPSHVITSRLSLTRELTHAVCLYTLSTSNSISRERVCIFICERVVIKSQIRIGGRSHHGLFTVFFPELISIRSAK